MEVLSVSWLAHVLQCYPKYCERLLHKLARSPHWHHDCSQALYLYHQKCKSINLPVPKRGARILRDTLVGCQSAENQDQFTWGIILQWKDKIEVEGSWRKSAKCQSTSEIVMQIDYRLEYSFSHLYRSSWIDCMSSSSKQILRTKTKTLSND